MPHNGLVVERLSKSWGAHSVFSNISFTQPRGTIFGFKGENGSGKSTLLKIIAGIVPADEGEVRFESETQKNRMRWSSLIGYVPQELALDERFTVRETLLFWAAARGFPKSERKRWVTIAEQDPLISSFLSKKISECSGGMARRCSLLVGLLGDPPILLLDEPFAGADDASQDMMVERLKACRARGQVILVASHDATLIDNLCDRVLLLQKGILLEEKANPCPAASRIASASQQSVPADENSGARFIVQHAKIAGTSCASQSANVAGTLCASQPASITRTICTSQFANIAGANCASESANIAGTSNSSQPANIARTHYAGQAANTPGDARVLSDENAGASR